MINDSGGFYDGYDTGVGYTGITTDVSTRHYHNNSVSPMGRKRGGRTGGGAIIWSNNIAWRCHGKTITSDCVDVTTQQR